MHNGVADPLGLLGLPPEDFGLMQAVVAEADRLRLEREKASLDYLSVAVINQLARAMKGR